MKQLRFVSVHEMSSLVPNTRYSDSSAATPVLKLICPNLVRIDADLQIRPELAASWDCEDDGRTYRFYLRKGLVFHNGAPLTAESVKSNFMWMFDQRNDSPSAYDFDLLEQINCINEHTIEFVFKKPFPAFLYHLGGRSHIAADSMAQPVGAGPYKLKEWVHGRYLRLKKFDAYWDADNVINDEVLISWAPTAEERSQIIENQSFDIMEAVPAAAVPLTEQGLLNVLTSPSTFRYTMAFNCQQAPFNHVKLRSLVAKLIDVDALASQFIPNYQSEQSLQQSQEQKDSSQAETIKEIKALLAQLGYDDGVTVQTVCTAVSPLPAIAKEVAQTLALCGIQLDIRHYEDPPWWPHIYIDGNWQVAFQTMGTRAHPDALYRREFATQGPFNATGYSNEKVDQLLIEAQSTPNAETLYEQVKQQLAIDAPVIDLCETQTVAGIRPGVQHFSAHPLGYWDIERVKVE